MATQALSSFTVGIGFDVDQQSARRTADNFNMLKKTALGLAGALAGSFGFDALTRGFAQQTDAINKYAKSIGAVTSKVKAFDVVGQLAGLNAGESQGIYDALFSTLKELGSVNPGGILQSMAEARIGGTITKGMTPTQALLAISDAIQGMSAVDRAIALNSIGLSERQGMALSSPNVRAQIAEAEARRPLRPGDADISAAYNDQMVILLENFGRIADTLSREILPPINDFLTGINKILGWTQGRESTRTRTGASRNPFAGRSEPIDLQKAINKMPEVTSAGRSPPRSYTAVVNLDRKKVGEAVLQETDIRNTQAMEDIGSGSQ